MRDISVIKMSILFIFLGLLAFSSAQQGCPPLSCPANCDVTRGPNGCNVCNCPQPPVCSPLPGCPSNCQQRFDDVGCPMCDCGTDGNLCAALPSCPRGCISRNPTTNCFICNCSPSQNQIGAGFGGFGNNGFGNGGFNGGNGFGVRGFGGNNFGAGTFGGGVFGNTGFTGQQCRRLQCPLNCRQVMGRDGCMQCMCDDNALLCPGVQVCYDRCQSLNENGCCDCTCPVNPGTFFGGPPGGQFGPFGPIPAGSSPTTSALAGPPNPAAERFIPQNLRGGSPGVALLRGRQPTVPLRPTVQPGFGRFPVQNPTLQPNNIPQNLQRFPLRTPNIQPGAFLRNPQRFPSQRPNVAFPSLGQRPNFQGIPTSQPQGIPLGINPQSPNVAFPNIGQRPNFQRIPTSQPQGIPIGNNPNGLIPANSRFPSTFVPTVSSQNLRPPQPVQPQPVQPQPVQPQPVQAFNPIPVQPQLVNPVPVNNALVPLTPQLNPTGTLVQPVPATAANIPEPTKVKASRVLTLTSVTTIAE